MDEKKGKLTFLEAASTVAGYGIGAGIMAVPYLAVRSGVGPLIGIMVVAYLISILFHLMLVDMTLRDGGRSMGGPFGSSHSAPCRWRAPALGRPVSSSSR